MQGIALVGNPDFALVDEAYPYISKRLLTDESPRLREALRCEGCAQQQAGRLCLCV